MQHKHHDWLLRHSFRSCKISQRKNVLFQLSCTTKGQTGEIRLIKPPHFNMKGLFCTLGLWIGQANVVLTRPGLCLSPVSQLEGVRRFGPMWKASFGPILTVHVADPALIEQVLRQEGQHPMRSDLSSWKDYRRLRGHHYGLLTSWVFPSCSGSP